jgi:hypothetical protein
MISLLLRNLQTRELREQRPGIRTEHYCRKGHEIHPEPASGYGVRQ